MMVVPTGGSESPILLLGCGPAVGPVGCGDVVCAGAEAAVRPTVGLGAAVLVAEPVDGAPEAVAWVVEVPRPVLDGEDPPHAASSSSDPRPAAAAHPLLRITSLLLDGSFPAWVRRERHGFAPVTLR
jgi:hypothetical protein